mmetsp:Transcript_20366/g.47758  ORF Transcript_20366/g.47758 Transcript_20366/m.47758 type:complete len:87 (+) Transcript_20366:244-504(+)
MVFFFLCKVNRERIPSINQSFVEKTRKAWLSACRTVQQQQYGSPPHPKKTNKQTNKQKTLHRENSIYQAAVVVAMHASPIVCMQGT